MILKNVEFCTLKISDVPNYSMFTVHVLAFAETTLNVDLFKIAAGNFKNVAYTKYQAHDKEWTRQGNSLD